MTKLANLKRGFSLKRLWKDDSGVTAIEYALLASLIAVVIIGGVTTLGNTLSTVFGTVNAALN